MADLERRQDTFVSCLRNLLQKKIQRLPLFDEINFMSPAHDILQ